MYLTRKGRKVHGIAFAQEVCVNADEQQAWLADSSFGSSRQGHKDNPTSFELGCQVITLCACSSSVGLTIPRHAKKLFGVGETLRRDDLADRAVLQM